ncbi:MAG: hypothetical protein NWE99_03985 [Candidatus Bathyarchaeota archaeon]|nr:hypothetical protein [Candidatus Bathyarchaeota archaeon]
MFIGYPYFGENMLEHDPSIGVEGVAAWLPVNLLLILVGTTGVIAVAAVAVRVRKKLLTCWSFENLVRFHIRKMNILFREKDLYMV